MLPSGIEEGILEVWEYTNKPLDAGIVNIWEEIIPSHSSVNRTIVSLRQENELLNSKFVSVFGFWIPSNTAAE
jgi:hypothetical protein